MNRIVTVLVVVSAVFGIGAILLFAEARSNTAVIRDGIGIVTLVNAEWVALLLLAAVSGSTALVLAYVFKAVDVLRSPGHRTEVDEA